MPTNTEKALAGLRADVTILSTHVDDMRTSFHDALQEKDRQIAKLINQLIAFSGAVVDNRAAPMPQTDVSSALDFRELPLGDLNGYTDDELQLRDEDEAG